jgi:DNA-binding transcriptional regulator YiaG
LIDLSSTDGRIIIERGVFVTGNDIRREREALGLTQGQLADLLGVALNTVSRWEIGQRTPHPLAQKAIQTVFAEIRSKRIKAKAKEK